MRNQLKTMILLVVISGIFLLLGYAIGGSTGVIMALGLSLMMNFGAYWFSDKIVLSMHQAQPIGIGHESGTYELVEELCSKASIPMPKVYLVPEWTPNAFATGRDPQHAAVAVTQGILKILNKRELRAVLAHEISHIKNRDILVSTVVAAVASAIMYLVHILQWSGLTGSRRGGSDRAMPPAIALLTILLAPLVATLVQSAISRTREYMADESGANICDDPEGLALALEKISDPKMVKSFQKDEMMPDMQPAFSHLYIMNHFSGESIFEWFSTHPPVKDRVSRLRAMRVGG